MDVPTGGSAGAALAAPSLAPSAQPPTRPPSAFAHIPPPTPDPTRITKMRYSHQAMADLIIANPTISQNALALHFGYTAAWVSRIMGSDAWQSYMAERTKELVDPAIRASIDERLKGLMLRSIEILEHKLEHPPGEIPDNLALRTGELAAKALGYGARPTAVVNVNVEQHLEDLGGRLTGLLRREKVAAGVTVDAELVEDTGD